MTRILTHISILTLTFSCILNSCLNASNNSDTAQTGYRFAYDLTSPDAEYKLQNILREISGISWYKHNIIACIQDEQAVIYLFDTEEERISDSYSFGKHGDYEDIAVYQDTAWVLESNGTLYKVKKFSKENRETLIYPTILSARNNTEGLVYDVSGKYLLIACKNQSYLNGREKLNGFKAIYRFGTSDNKLKENPEFLIDLTMVNDFIKTKYLKSGPLNLAKKLNLKDNPVFQPSGMAIHPLNDELYVISATPGKLIVMSRGGNIKNILPLDKSIFSQPEGICFSPEGDLYISNEGKNGRGNILKFHYRPI